MVDKDVILHDNDERTPGVENPADAYAKARRDLDPATGMAIPGQLNAIDAEGTVHNWVGPQSVPLTNKRDGGPYLDEGEAARAQLRRDYVLSAPSTVGVEDAPIIAGNNGFPAQKDSVVRSGDDIDKQHVLDNTPTGTPTVVDGDVVEFSQEDLDQLTNDDDNRDDGDDHPVEPTDEELFGNDHDSK